MTLTDFKTVIRAYVPGAKIGVIGDPLMTLLINKAVDDVNIKSAALRGNSKFTVTAEQQDYAFSSVLPNYQAMAEGSIWWNAGSASSPDWRRLDAYTRRSLTDQFPRWSSESSGNPLRYFPENDTLTIYPKPDTTLSDGFWAFYIKKATYMTDGAHYPFTGSATEIASLRVLDDAIIDYVRWKLALPLSNEPDQRGLIVEQDYDKSVAIRIKLLNRRLDLGSNNSRMRGPDLG